MERKRDTRKKKIRDSGFSAGDVVILLCFVLFLIAGLGSMYVSRIEYTVVYGDTVCVVETDEGLDKALELAGISAGFGESVKVSGEGQKRLVEVSGCVTVFITVDGETVIVYTCGQCVRDALSAAGIEMGENDIISERPGELLYDGMEIEITTVRYEYDSCILPVAAQVVYVYNPAAPEGSETVISGGTAGQESVIYRSTYVGGALTEREEYGRCTVLEPTDRIIEVGTGGTGGSFLTTADGRERAAPENVTATQETQENSNVHADWSDSGDEGDSGSDNGKKG